jgi:hypothetical protein
MNQRAIYAAVGAAAAMALTSVGFLHGGLGGGPAKPPRPSVIRADADNLLPSDSAADWATYGDHLVEATVTSETALPASDEEQQAGEGFIPREIDLRIDKVLWSRTGAPAAPASFDTQIDGWQFHGDTRTPIRIDGEPDMAVGDQVVLPITYLSQDDVVENAGWSPLSADSILDYDGSTLGHVSGAPVTQVAPKGVTDAGTTAGNTTGGTVITTAGSTSGTTSGSTSGTDSGTSSGTDDGGTDAGTDAGTDGSTDDGPPPPPALADQVQGQPLSTLVTDLQQATPDPQASPASSAPPDQRYRAAAATELGTR